MATATTVGKVASVLACVLFASHALGVDFLEAAPTQTKVLLENEKVRVIDVKFKKGDKIPMHSHPALVVYVMKGGAAKFTTADGKSFDGQGGEGATAYREPTTHAHEHLEDTHAIVVELKQ